MNVQDFAQWLDDYSKCFPLTASWLKNQGVETIDRWRQVFVNSRVTLLAAKAVNMKILGGELDPPERYDQTPAHVIRSAREIQPRTVTVTSEAENYEAIRRARQTGDWPAGKIFRAVRTRIEAGESPCYACRNVFREFPVVDDERGPTYSCRLCWDNSTRTMSIVVDPLMSGIAAIARGAKPITTGVVACTCNEGVKLNRMRQVPLVEFDPARHIPATGSAEMIRELCAQFVASSGGRRVSAFDDFNRAG